VNGFQPKNARHGAASDALLQRREAGFVLSSSAVASDFRALARGQLFFSRIWQWGLASAGGYMVFRLLAALAKYRIERPLEPTRTFQKNPTPTVGVADWFRANAVQVVDLKLALRTEPTPLLHPQHGSESVAALAPEISSIAHAAFSSPTLMDGNATSAQ
jgi:hypothetical protein